MILQDIPYTLGPAVGQVNTTVELARQVQAFRAALAAILLAGDRAARGGRLVEVHGQAVVILGAEQWQEVRRAMIAAGQQMVAQPGRAN